MTGRRFLLFHVTPRSGHFRASRALEHTLRRLDPNASITNVDAFTYTSRFVRWAISRSYYSLIRHQPDVWEYLYDNPSVHRQVQQLRVLLHRYHAAKLRRLLETVRPDAIACTQAFPCGMVADFKKHHGLSTPLIGILTDYAPHLYWFHETVDVYVVPSDQVKLRFLARSIEPSRVQVLGVPIDLKFMDTNPREAVARRFGLQLEQPILLIMGGSSGFGPLKEILLNLDILPHPCQLVVVTGSNRPLLAWMLKHRFRHRVVPLGFSEHIPELMDIATLLISKPGGLTTSEALTKRLPLVIINPIPGQEAYNARYLLSQGAAVQASGPDTVRQTVRDLLDNPERLEMLRQRCGQLARPAAALDIAKLLCDLADGSRRSAPVTPHEFIAPGA